MTNSPLAEAAPPEPEAGAALLEAVAAALPDLEALLAHANELGHEPTAALEATLLLARARLTRDAPHVVVVGEQKSGKSTFLNALLGERVLGTAARECTATVTRLRWADAFDYVAQFVDGRSSQFSVAVPDRASVFAAVVHKLQWARQSVESARTPLGELPARLPEEPALPDAMQEALVDAYRSLSGASVDLDAARELLPKAYQGQASWLKRLAAWWPGRRAVLIIEREEIRHSEAARGVCQAQASILAWRINALEQVAQAQRAARHARFLAEMFDLTDQAGQGQGVLTLDLAYPGRYLPKDLVLIDTPGLNTDEALHRERAWQVIREEADGCWLVSDIQQALSRSTRDFIQDLRPHVAHVFLVLTKVDRAMANAEGVGEGDPSEQVDEARKLAVKRFARELDRSTREVFAVAVAAEQALQDDRAPLAVGFGKAIETLVALARQERAIVLGARAAGAVRTAVQGIEHASQTARATYARRINDLEDQRIPQPEAFKAEQMARVRPRLTWGLAPVTTAVVLQAKLSLARQQTAWQIGLLKATDEDDLKQTATRFGNAEPVVIAEMLEEGLASLRKAASNLLQELEGPAFEELLARYRVTQVLTGATTALVPLPAPPELPIILALGTGLDEALVTFQTDRLQLGVGGAAAGAALGSLVMPGVGTLVGALVGSLAAFFVSLDDLKADCVKELDARVAATEARLAGLLDEAANTIEATVARTLELGLADALKRYAEYIDDLLGAERLAIERLQARLADLDARLDALLRHEALIEKCRASAVEASRGLARAPQDEPSPGATIRLNLKGGRRGTGGFKSE